MAALDATRFQRGPHSLERAVLIFTRVDELELKNGKLENQVTALRLQNGRLESRVKYLEGKLKKLEC